jgi:hypothetical protein
MEWLGTPYRSLAHGDVQIVQVALGVQRAYADHEGRTLQEIASVAAPAPSVVQGMS